MDKVYDLLSLREPLLTYLNAKHLQAVSRVQDIENFSIIGW